MIKPVNQNPPYMLEQGKQIEKKGCNYYSCWFFQIALWIILVIIIILAIAGSEAKSLVAFYLGLCYIWYLYLEFRSSTSKYLCNKNSSEGIYEKMRIYFRTPPEISFYCECYHYNIEIKYIGSRRYIQKYKVITYKDTYVLPYYSERDVSGLFYLNCDKASAERKYYIKLKLEKEIDFADAISYMDYECEKEKFLERNGSKDSLIHFVENRNVPGMSKQILIRMTDQELSSVNFGFFFLATILAFSEIYKIYVDSFCVYQEFKIRKLVSTRYDLNLPLYQNFVPQINLIVKQFHYQPQDYNYVNNQYQVQYPTQEELEKAKEYQDKVPNYQISSGQGNIQAEVIVDNPGYSSYEANNNKPPTAFALNGGDVAINSNQINANGNLPSEFGKSQLPKLEFNTNPNVHPLNEDIDTDQSQRKTLQPNPSQSYLTTK